MIKGGNKQMQCIKLFHRGMNRGVVLTFKVAQLQAISYAPSGSEHPRAHFRMKRVYLPTDAAVAISFSFREVSEKVCLCGRAVVHG